MNALRRHSSILYRFMAERVTGIALTPVPAVLLVLISLTGLAVLSFACKPVTPVSTPTGPIHVRDDTITPSPTNTATPTVTPTPTPTLLPPVILEEPKDGDCLPCRSDVVLRWNSSHDLGEKESYQVRVKGQDLTYCKENHLLLDDLSPGVYDWDAAIVRSVEKDTYEQVSKKSNCSSFTVLSFPIVDSVSPTSTVRGVSVPVTITGENFLPSVVVTIGMPLEVILVNSTTLTATVPETLMAGEYPVVVSGVISTEVPSVFFTVNEPRQENGNSSHGGGSPWNPATPVPPAPPDYDPNTACVVNPCAPAPQLIEPEDVAQIRLNSGFDLKWTWNYCLPPEWKFAIRISDPNIALPHSRQYIDDHNLVKCQNGKAEGTFHVSEEFTEDLGVRCWNIAVVRSGGEGWERLSDYSEIRSFNVFDPSSGHNPIP